MESKNILKNIIEKYSSRTFIIDSQNDTSLTFSDFGSLVLKTAGELKRRNISRGDRVAILLPNSLEFAVLYFSCIHLGAVAVPINQNLNSKDISFIISNSATKLVAYLPVLKDKLDGSNKIETLCVGGETGIDIFKLPAPGETVPFTSIDPEDIVAIMYTSGTTSKPKGVVHKLNSMLRNARVFAEFNGISAESRFYHTFSMAYMAGFFNLLILPYISGSSVVIGPLFNARLALSYWDAPRKYNVNALWLVPSIMALLLKVDRGESGASFCRNSVKHAFVGTAPLSAKTKSEFEDKYGITMNENYGLSETLFITAESNSMTHKPGAIGEVLPGIEVKSELENNKGAEGEILVRTPDLMTGYLDSETGAVNALNPSDWFPTGDYGFVDSGGYLFLTGRKKDIIIRGGINISPKAIEEQLIRHDAVDEVYVVGIPHELYGEDIVAVVKLKPGFDFEQVKVSLAAFARENLAQHQQPAMYLTMDEFPLGIGGKIQKHKLREIIFNKLQLKGFQ